MVIHIDPEFERQIQPLSAEEFEQLKENILNDGEVYEPIITWNGTIVDGHNRWKIISDYPEIPYTVKEMEFADKWAAFDWMIKKQLGRRNLTKEMQDRLRGKMYTARKNSNGGDRRSENFSEVDNQHLKNKTTAYVIAEELGISEDTVKRNEKFSIGIDSIQEKDKEASDKILQGKTGITKKTVIEFPNMEPEKQTEVIEAIKNDTVREYQKVNAEQIKRDKPKAQYNGGGTREYREQMTNIASVVAQMYDESPIEFTISDLIDDIIVNADMYIRLLNNQIKDHIELVKGDSENIISDTIETNIIAPIERIRRMANETRT